MPSGSGDLSCRWIATSIVCAGLLPTGGVLSVRAATYYVATNGSDGATGTVGAPFATIQHAANTMGSGDTCLIRAGFYHEDVQVANKDGLTFAAYPGEAVVLDGSRTITSQWTLHTNTIFKTTLTEDVWQLFADGEMMIPARWPNADPTIDFWQQRESDHWAEGRDPRTSSPPVDTNGTMYDKPHDGIDLAASGLDLTGAIAILNLGSFRTQTRFITAHTPGSNLFTYDPVTIDFKDKEHFYFVEGKLALLDAENEWFYDPATQTLYAWVPGGGNPAAVEIKGKTITYGLTATRCDDLTVSGIDFFAATFFFDDCLRARVEHGILTYPSCTRRMLGILGAPQTTRIEQGNGSTLSACVVYNCVFRYTDGHGIFTKGAENVIENCYFHHIDYSASDLPAIMAALYMEGQRNVFRHNTVHTFGASVAYFPGDAGIVEYNNLYDGGYVQHDGAMIQVMVNQQLNARIGWNWVHDWPRLGVRFDGSGGQGGRVHHTVGWNANSTVYIGNHENNEILNNSGIFSTARNEIVVESGGNPPVNNTNTVTRNNLAARIGGTNNGFDDVPGHYDHNWNGQVAGQDIRTQLRDPDNLDFRPRPGADIVDAGVVFPGVTDGYIGDAPDKGAYEFDDPVYWIPGHRREGASMPVPPNGSTTVQGSAALMWLAGLEANSCDVYLGTDANAVAVATPADPAFRTNQVTNVYDPLGLLEQTYYWRVDSVTPTGVVTGEVWTFAPAGVTVQAPGIVNTPARSITASTATIGGEVTDGGTASRVTIYWWPDGGATNQVELGVQAAGFSTGITGLLDGVVYHYRCFAQNRYGSTLAATTESFTATGTVVWTELTYDDFENGFGNYTDGGADCFLYTGGAFAHQGSNAVDIQRSGVAGSFAHTRGIDVDTPGYTRIKVAFWFLPVSMDAGGPDSFVVQYFDGSDWITLRDYVTGVDFTNDVFQFEELIVEEASHPFPVDMKIRFMCDANGGGDDVYIDEIRVSALGPVAPASSYDQWGSGFGLNGTNASYFADPDGDGLVNLYEYGTGGVPTNGSDGAFLLLTAGLVEDGGSTWMELVYRRRTDAAARGLGYGLELSPDLAAGTWSTNGYVETGSAPLEAGFEAVTNRIPTDIQPDQAVRLEISIE